MDKQVCFVIEKQKLLLEKKLVLFNDIPLFFVCRNEDNKRYIVLCTDLEKFEYLVIETNLSNLRNMLLQKCTMKDLILAGKKFFKVASGDTIEDDLYEEIKIDDIDPTLLPKDGAYYKKVFQEDEDYVEHVESEYLESLKFDVISGINILVNSVDLLTESINSVVESLTEHISTMVGYFDVGPSIDSISNGMKEIFSNAKIDIESMKAFEYKCHDEKTISSVIIKNGNFSNNDTITNFAA